MPQAVDSNSTNTSGIHPATSLIEKSLDGLSSIFQAYRAVAENTPQAGEDGTKAPDSMSIALACLIKRFEQQKNKITALVKELDRAVAEGVASPDIKALRDEFIIEKLRQGLSAGQISQALNLRLSVINRIIEQLYPEPDTINNAATPICPQG